MKALIVTVLFAGILSFSFASEKESQKANKDKVETKLFTTLRGEVVDQKTNEALVGVKIVLEGTDQVAYTDFDGKYQFENIETGAYNLTASYISYEQTSVENVGVSLKKSQVDFSLRTAN
jgi:hypothetical protein